MPRYEPPLAPGGDNPYARPDSVPSQDPQPAQEARYADAGGDYPDRYSADPGGDGGYPEHSGWYQDGVYLPGAPSGEAYQDGAYPGGSYSGSYPGESYPGESYAEGTYPGGTYQAGARQAGAYPVREWADDPQADQVWEPAGAEPPYWAAGGVPPRRSGTAVRRLALVLGVALAICGAASATGYLLLRDEVTPPTSAPSPDPPKPSVPPTGDGTPLPQSSTDVRFVAVGQCVRNDGGTEDPKLTITPCAPRTYEVLERFDGPTTGKDDARSKCSAVPGYTDWYFFDSPLDVLDYVLCLKSR